jgi:hypothetical protein
MVTVKAREEFLAASARDRAQAMPAQIIATAAISDADFTLPSIISILLVSDCVLDGSFIQRAFSNWNP